MKVFDFLQNTNGMPTSGRNSEGRQPQAVHAVIKEKISSREAFIEIEGKKVRAVFENGVPTQSHIAVQVTAANEDAIQVRVTQQARAEANADSVGNEVENVERLIRNAGIRVNSEMRQAAQILLKGKQPVTKEIIRNLDQILQKGEGTVGQKLDVLQTMAKKNIHVTVKSFEAVFRTLHGPTLEKLMERIADELPELAGKTERSEATAAQKFHRSTKAGVVESNVRIERPEVRLVQQLATLRDAIAQAEKNRGAINKEQLQKLAQEMENTLKTAKESGGVSETVAQRVGQLTKQIQSLTQSSLAQPKLPIEQVVKVADRNELNHIMKTIVTDAKAKERKGASLPSLDLRPSGNERIAKQAAKQEGERIVRTESQASLARQLEALVKVISGREPINKEALRAFVQQIKSHPELARINPTVKEQIQKSAQQVEQIIRATPIEEKAIQPERLKPSVHASLDRAVERVVRELEGNRGNTEQVKEKAAVGERLPNRLETIAKAIATGQPVNKEALHQIVELVKRDQALVQLSEAARGQIQKVITQVGQAMQETSQTEKMISADKLTRFIDRMNLEQAVKQVSGELKAVQAKQEAVNASFIVKEKDAPAKVVIQEKQAMETKGQPLPEKLHMLAKAIASGGQLDKKLLEQFVQQIKQSPELKDISIQIRQTVQQAIASLEKTIHHLPPAQSTISGQTLVEKGNLRLLEQAVSELHSQEKGKKDVQLSSDRKPQPATVEKETVPPKENAVLKAQREVAERVIAMRAEGRVTRQQIEGLQQAVQHLVRESGGSVALQQDAQRFMEQVGKDLRMSMSYDAVGRSAEGKILVQRTTDQLVQMFKLPISEVAKGEALQRQAAGQQPSPPVVLETMAQTYDRLSGIIAAARMEMQSTSGVTSSMLLQGNERSGLSFNLEMGRMPQQILQDVQLLLEKAAETEGLSEEMVQKLTPLLSKLKEMATAQASLSMTDFDTLVEQDSTLYRQIDVDKTLANIEQLFEEEAGRLTAYANVQAANFERVSHYIPENLHQVAEEFKQTKKEIISNIERMSQFLRQEVPQATSYIKQVIEPTIEMVNRLVSKGEFALFADMEFEHTVLKISGQLHDIKSMLDKGQSEEALRSFQDVRNALEKLNWQPSYMKVERFFSKKMDEGKMQSPFEMYSQGWKSNELTGRGVQEWMRGIGLGYEREAIEWMSRRAGENREMGTSAWNGGNVHSGSGQGPSVSSGGASPEHKSSTLPSFSQSGQHSFQSQDERPQTMKSIIMDQLENGNLPPRAREVLEQTLSNVTGQQLLSKHEPGAPVQTMYFQLPVPWEEGAQNMQMHIQSRNNGEQMDWENCSLFFFLSTPKFGDTGIGVTVVERDMTLRIQNDHPQAERAFKPYIPQLKEQLQGLGYRIQGVSFGTMKESVQDKQSPSTPLIDIKEAREQAASFVTRKGVDFSI
ncbi:hypothetical protein [Aneurinibacillus migulanus]|uniref:Flagellar hook-length control protein-like C-terminal domain-containing protein n=1 Tax=Aneurinibacillus migulanus TaxID=47500 RepID=A0A0D1UZE0_ANEMI|nr:hypothetical protein [Aneurinibacillus migulanus]KIV52454.1 hypothetical protein TS65_23945 [Aneurinibacillus migulanus]KON94633.1 hypothetical protein AF333_03120 [Aneurinibacillus migulanus]MED0892684.1 hypothetical protein [Aneurinibacillus migulanus]MED1614325.1 hypothetical protein [Aneurinibacillus migulanus]SDI48614.1 hypothetical protein SAMN04487909_104192 [Aneurinibacillus migulanus]